MTQKELSSVLKALLRSSFGNSKGAYAIENCSKKTGIPENRLRNACVHGELEKLQAEDYRMLSRYLPDEIKQAFKEWVFP